MELKLVTGLIDALGKVAGRLKFISNRRIASTLRAREALTKRPYLPMR